MPKLEVTESIKLNCVHYVFGFKLIHIFLLIRESFSQPLTSSCDRPVKANRLATTPSHQLVKMCHMHHQVTLSEEGGSSTSETRQRQENPTSD